MIAVLGAVFAASLDFGPATFGVEDVRRDQAEDDQFGYLADDGFLSYGFDGGPRVIEVNCLVAGSAPTAAALWGILGSHSTVTRTVRAFVGPRDPIGWLTSGRRDVKVRVDKRWMLRVLDPVAAVAGRGFPAGVQASMNLRLTDPVLPGNAGEYTLTVEDGTGRLVKGAPADSSSATGPVRLGARGFAALFAGTPVNTLRVAGLASGGEAAAGALLGAVFAGTPYMIDSF